MPEKILLKDILINKDKISLIATAIKSIHKEFDNDSFLFESCKIILDLELKERIKSIAILLNKYLPRDYIQSLSIILKALPPENLSENSEFIYAVYADYVDIYGQGEGDYHMSMNALYEITKRFSAEFAIRSFINKYPEQTLSYLETWASDDNYHVRRLASEGTRMKLPWAKKVNIDYKITKNILHKLFNDNYRYVTRSVANHINDLTKIDSDYAMDLIESFIKMTDENNVELKYVIKHALRNLIKSGNERALSFINIEKDVKGVEIQNFKCDEKVLINKSLNFSFDLICNCDKSMLIDYIIYFKNKNGYSKKIFKLKKIDHLSGVEVSVKKSHKHIGDMTTRKLLTGVHRLEIQVNGVIMCEREYEVMG